MKQKMLIILSLIFLIALLIGLNAASYRKKEKKSDVEYYPNRSTFNSGSTGTKAFYELLSETGKKVTRWQEAPSSLLTSKNSPKTFVIIGLTRLEINDKEAEQILRWVSKGGKLVIIDRTPPELFLSSTANWSFKNITSNKLIDETDPANSVEMTAETPAIKPSQPSVFTRNIIAVQPSKFASSIQMEYLGADQIITAPANVNPPPVYKFQEQPTPAPIPIYGSDEPLPRAAPGKIEEDTNEVETSALNAPFVHISDKEKNILVDFPYGSGQIVYLTDPYIVSNSGIKLVDNAQLAINIVASNEGLIAFDEFHQGYGANSESIFTYLEGTPVVAIFAQIALLVGVLFWSQSRRFARPLPAIEPNRLSKLEYVSAMAELQQRTKAYDLALENIYSEFRRSATRLFGMDNFTSTRKDIAKAISERINVNEMEIYNRMKECEEIIHGEPTNKKKVLELANYLRELEEKLGLKRTRKQAFRK